MFNLFFWKKPKKNLTILYLMVFFLTLTCALPAYIQSSYLEGVVGLSAVNLFFISSNIISIIAILFFPYLIKKLGNYFSTSFIGFLFILALVGLGFGTNPWLIFLFFISMQVLSNLIYINMDIFVENFSQNSSTGQTRTIYFTIINLAWVISPSVSAWLINLDGYSSVFLVAALLLVPFLLILLAAGHKIKEKYNYKKIALKKTVRTMFQNKDLRGVFGLAALLNVFYNATTVFMPIYLNQTIGFSWTEIGLIFSIMLLPFLIVEIPAGIISDKYTGEKEFFFIGYLILITCLVLFFSSTSQSFWFWAGLLFISRIGAALVEAMRESYFFKKVDAKEITKINIFRTATPLGYLIGSILSVVTLIFLPISYIFIVTAVVLCSSFYFLLAIKDTK